MGSDTWKKETKMKEVNATNLQYLCDLTLEQQPIGFIWFMEFPKHS